MVAVCCSKPVKNSDLHPEKNPSKMCFFNCPELWSLQFSVIFNPKSYAIDFYSILATKIVMQFRKCRGGGILGFFRLSKVFRLSKLFRFYKVCSQSFPSREMEKRMTMAYRVLSFRVYTSTIRALCNNITTLTLIFLQKKILNLESAKYDKDEKEYDGGRGET